MTTYTPHKWVIIEITTPDYSAKKVFAGWHGGFANGDSWRVSSGIVDIEKQVDLEKYHVELLVSNHYKMQSLLLFDIQEDP